MAEAVPLFQRSERLFSLVVLLISLAASLVGTAWAMMVTARWVGSPRGRIGPATLCVAVIVVFGIGFTVAAAAVTPPVPTPLRGSPTTAAPDADRVAAFLRQAGITLALAALQLAVDFAVIRRTFRLSVARTFAPFGAYLGVAVLGLVIEAAVVKPYVIEAFVIPTATMSPTLDAGDRILVNKHRAPRRWDVVVYRVTNRRSTQFYSKRLVGLPGERLCFDGTGGLLVDGRPATDVPPVMAGRLHARLWPDRPQPTGYVDGKPITLTADQYFFVGDNVAQSVDSRMLGPSDGVAIVGVAEWVYWPPRHARLLRW